MKGYAREKMREITADRSALRKCRNAVSAGVLSPISSAVGRNGAVGDKRNARAGGAAPAASRCCACGRRGWGVSRPLARVTFFFCKKKVTKENHLDLRFKDPLARGGFRRCGGEQVLRLRARDGAFRAPARVTFFFCKKKVTKENHLDLRSKGPLARGGQVQIWRCLLAGEVQRSSLSVKRTVPAFTGAEASATACPSHGRGICFYRVSDYQIAPLPPQGGKGRCARWARI